VGGGVKFKGCSSNEPAVQNFKDRISKGTQTLVTEDTSELIWKKVNNRCMCGDTNEAHAYIIQTK
jgi:hypothetical protein